MCKRRGQPGGATNAGRKGRQYSIFNATDGVWAYPDTVGRRQAKQIIRKLKERYERQGFYAAVGGRIPISMLSLKLTRLTPTATRSGEPVEGRDTYPLFFWLAGSNERRRAIPVCFRV